MCVEHGIERTAVNEVILATMLLACSGARVVER